MFEQTKEQIHRSKRYTKYKEILLLSGFLEARKQEGHFYKQTTEKAAFVVNLLDEVSEYYECISIIYGFASTACMAGDEEWVADNGVDNDSCQIRNILVICSESDEKPAFEAISLFFGQYQFYTKDEILAVRKERQKEFLGYFTRALKPLGFKKKAARWTKELGNKYSLSVDAQKSMYSDQYYINISIHDSLDFYKRSYYDRVIMFDRDIYNWQLMSEEQINNLIQHMLKTYVLPKLGI